MNNGQGSGDTETGSYTLTPFGISKNSITRNAEADIVLPSEDEWYKAAYYDSAARGYWDYPVGSHDPPDCEEPSNLEFKANCDNAVRDFTDVASYVGSPSPNGTFDQGGNIMEWNEGVSGLFRVTRGGGYGFNVSTLAASTRLVGGASASSNSIGFRVVSVPEPDAALLQSMTLLVLALLPRRRVRLSWR